MKGLTISDHDHNGNLAIDLNAILQIIGEKALNSCWKASHVEALGEEAANELHSLADEGTILSGRRLMELANEIWQVVDGTFEAFTEDDESPWLIIDAVDSSAFDVRSTDEGLLQTLRSQFTAVTDLPDR